jgi:haloalkane dehalogenase
MKTVRTPDEQFVDLAGYPFEPNYVEIPDGEGGTLRVHYLDEGPADAAPVLLLHGEPSWSYLYRHMIPPLVAAGHRVVVPDQVGFGRSDKPTEQSDYSYARHIEWMSALIFDELDLRDVTFFGQDWGGLIGLRLVTAQPDRFARLVIANTGLPTGDQPMSDAFMAWQKFSQTADEFPIGMIIKGAVVTEMTPDVVAGYAAPFPDDSFLAGARIWPSFVPTSPDDPESANNRAAWGVLREFDKPILCCFSDQDPVTAGGEAPFMALPGAQGQTHVTIEDGGHFLQEDKGPEIAQIMIDFMASS